MTDMDTLWQMIGEAQREWDYQRDLDVESLPDCPLKEMSPEFREAHLQARLLNRLYAIIAVGGAIRGHEWSMRHAD